MFSDEFVNCVEGELTNIVFSNFINVIVWEFASLI